MVAAMELRHLRYFLAVAATENVTKAALELQVSQPAVSRQIRDLEAELGFPLFERGAKSLKLTAAGRSFQEEAKAVLARLEDGMERSRSVASGEVGELQIGYAMSPTVRLLPEVLREFQRLKPRVKVKLHDLSTDEMITKVREGQLDLAFLVRVESSWLKKLQWEDLGSVAVCLAVAPGHPFAQQSQVTLATVSGEALVVFSAADYPEYHEFLTAIFRKEGLPYHISREHDSIASLIASVEAGTGVAILTDSIACFAGPRLKLLSLVPSPPPLTLSAVWSKGKLGETARLFLECARKVKTEVSLPESV